MQACFWGTFDLCSTETYGLRLSRTTKRLGTAASGARRASGPLLRHLPSEQRSLPFRRALRLSVIPMQRDAHRATSPKRAGGVPGPASPGTGRRCRAIVRRPLTRSGYLGFPTITRRDRVLAGANKPGIGTRVSGPVACKRGRRKGGAPPGSRERTGPGRETACHEARSLPPPPG